MRIKSSKLLPLPFFTSAANRSRLYPIVLECVKAIEGVGIGVWGFHSECAPGKWEIALCPNSPLQAVDNLTYVHELIKDITHKHGLHVTFHPQAFPQRPPTAGQHTHVSINEKDGSMVPAAISDSFLAGMMDKLPATCAFLNGGIDSYGNGRSLFTGQGPVMFSTGKFAPVRRDTEKHFEIRLADTLANPHLQLAAIIASGLQGVFKQTKLEMKPADRTPLWTPDPPTDAELESWGVSKWLPRSLDEALDELDEESKDDAGITSIMGRQVVLAYIAFKREEARLQSRMEPGERRKAMVRNL